MRVAAHSRHIKEVLERVRRAKELCKSGLWIAVEGIAKVCASGASTSPAKASYIKFVT